jgi:hypothetical protein
MNKDQLSGMSREELEMRLEQLSSLLETVIVERNEALAAGGFCEKHTPNGGSRTCVICGMIELSYCFSQVDYALGDPSSGYISDYDLSYDHELVLSKVLKMKEEAMVGKRYRDELLSMANGELLPDDASMEAQTVEGRILNLRYERNRAQKLLEEERDRYFILAKEQQTGEANEKNN